MRSWLILLLYFSIINISYTQSTFEITGTKSICSNTNCTLTANNCNGTVIWSTGDTTTSIIVTPLTTTVYIAYCKNGSNIQTASHCVGIISTPKINATGILCSENNTELSVTNIPSKTQRWLQNAQLINNSNINAYIANQPGIYTVENISPGTWEHLQLLPYSETLLSPTSEDLKDIQFVSSKIGYIAGDRGTILKTTNRGDFWSILTTNINNDLKGLYFINNDTGWAVGDGVVIKTIDGGMTWQKLPIGTSSSWKEVFFTDVNNGFIISHNGGGILKTIDGGNTWTTPYGLPLNNWLDIYFVNASKGWIVGENGLIYTTTDGGINWQAQVSGTSNALSGVYFSDSNNGWITISTGNTQFLLTTANGGVNWVSRSTSYISLNSFDVQALNGSKVYAIGGNGVVLTITNSTISASTLPNNPTLNAIYNVAQDSVFVVGAQGQIYRKVNNNADWQIYGTTNLSPVNDIAFVSSQKGWIACNSIKSLGNNIIYTTDNGGKTWQVQASKLNENLRGIHFINSTNGCAVGTSILTTTDAGGNWIERKTGVNLQSVFFISSSVGWVVGNNGVIMKTLDGGITWTNQTSGTSVQLNKVFFIDSSIGWIVSSNGNILKTINGGIDWNTQIVTPYNTLNSIFFKNNLEGWVIGLNGNILKTIDGGETWVKISITQSNVYDIKFLNNSNGWVSSSEGLFFTQDGGSTWALSPHEGGLTRFSFVSNTIGWGIGNNEVFKFNPSNITCASNPINILVSPSIPSISSSADVICQGQSVVLSAGNCATQLKWSSGETTNNITVNPNYTTSYAVACTASNGCKSINSSGIGVISKPKIDTTYNSLCKNIALIAENVSTTADMIWKKDNTIIPYINNQKYITNEAGGYNVSINTTGMWIPISGNLSPGILKDISFITDNFGLCVGNLGNILKTEDGGETWKSVVSNTAYDLNRVTIVSTTVAWAIGTNGTIIKTTNGGINWVKQKIATTDNVLDITFANQDIGWLIAGSKIYYTNNGGNTWQLQYTHTSLLYSIKSTSANTVWASGASGSLLQTINAGSSWVSLLSGTTEALTDIEFFGTLNGWITTTNEKILRTTNGGVNWSIHNIHTTGRIQFVDTNNGFLTNQSNEFFYATTDGGLTWTRRGKGDSRNGYAQALFMKNTNEGIFVSYNGTIAKSTDGTNTWEPIPTSQNSISATAFNKIHFVNSNVGYCSEAFSNKFLSTIDGGKTWKSQLLPISTIDDIVFINQTQGWILSNDNILKTTNGGQTWISTQLDASLKNVFFIGATIGWIVGSNGTIYKSIDGGNSWMKKTSGVSSTLNKIYFINANQGWAVGSNGTIIRTVDGGDSWIIQVSGVTASFESVCFVNSNTGWTSTQTSEGIYKTIDGGVSWIKQDIDPSSNPIIYKIQFLDANNGVALSSNNVYHTTDGGITWKKSFHYNNINFARDIHFISPSEGWLSGRNLLRYQQNTLFCSSDTINILSMEGPSLQETIKSGNWIDPSVWSCGQIPTTNQNVIVKSPHIINILPSHIANCKNITTELGSVLNISPGALFEANSSR